MTMRRVLLPALLTVLVSGPAAFGATGRAGSSDLYFGIGALEEQEADMFGDFSLEAEQGSTVSLRWRLHFTDLFALETDLTHESGRTRLKESGSSLDSSDADTTFFLINGVFNLTRTPISPFVSVGFGSFDHEASGILFPDGSGSFILVDVEEDGGVLNVAAGLDGRLENRLIWLFEVRLLNYDFDDFSDDWNRLFYSGHIGFSF
jgi:hypothetical protein